MKTKGRKRKVQQLFSVYLLYGYGMRARGRDHVYHKLLLHVVPNFQMPSIECRMSAFFSILTGLNR